jgi:hypothetical protein
MDADFFQFFICGIGVICGQDQGGVCEVPDPGGNRDFSQPVMPNLQATT